MSETIIQTAVLVFAAGILGFALGCLCVRLLATGKTTADTQHAVADAPPVVSPSPAAEPQEPTSAIEAVPTDVSRPVADAAPVVSPPPPVELQDPAPVVSPPLEAEPQAQAAEVDVAPAPALGEPRQPQSLSQPRQSQADDLKKIKGIGPKLELILNELGVFHFDQIADWTPDHIAWIDAHLAFHGRVEREEWIRQAAAFAKSGSGGAA